MLPGSSQALGAQEICTNQLVLKGSCTAETKDYRNQGTKAFAQCLKALLGYLGHYLDVDAKNLVYRRKGRVAWQPRRRNRSRVAMVDVLSHPA